MTLKGLAVIFDIYKSKKCLISSLLVTSGRNLVDMYKEELRLKELIYQNICHAKDRNSMMFYTSSWLHQPYIGDSSEVIMESLLLETGHKKLPI